MEYDFRFLAFSGVDDNDPNFVDLSVTHQIVFCALHSRIYIRLGIAVPDIKRNIADRVSILSQKHCEIVQAQPFLRPR